MDFISYLPLSILFEIPIMIIVTAVLLPEINQLSDPQEIMVNRTYEIVILLNQIKAAFYLLWCAYVTKRVLRIKLLHLLISTLILAAILIGFKFLPSMFAP